MKVVIIDYGAGNIQSLKFALKRLGVEADLTSDPEIIRASDKVIFPGVGEASSAMNMVRKHRLEKVITELKQPLLGICLGMQLLCESSEEGPTEGLGIFKTQVKRFGQVGKVPHMGWNTLKNLKSPLFHGIEEDSYVYLVHSYYAVVNSQTIALTEYGQPFASALREQNFYGVQFHPEKSSKVGAKILSNFLDLTT